MRRSHLSAVVVAALAVALAAGTVYGTAGAQTRPRRPTVPADHQPCDVPSRDNFGSLTVRPPGSTFTTPPVLVETWIRQHYADTCLPANVFGVARMYRAPDAVRVQAQVILHTRGGTTNQDIVAGPLNSAAVGNTRLLQLTTAASEPAGIPSFCVSWTEVRWSVRWTNGSLSSGVMVAPSDLFNDQCYFVP
jgi:hypothetical protein